MKVSIRKYFKTQIAKGKVLVFKQYNLYYCQNTGSLHLKYKNVATDNNPTASKYKK